MGKNAGPDPAQIEAGMYISQAVSLLQTQIHVPEEEREYAVAALPPSLQRLHDDVIAATLEFDEIGVEVLTSSIVEGDDGTAVTVTTPSGPRRIECDAAVVVVAEPSASDETNTTAAEASIAAAAEPTT